MAPQGEAFSPRKIILVAEDELLIALELELTLLNGSRGEQITPVARVVLKVMGVPFLLSSAYDRRPLIRTQRWPE